MITSIEVSSNFALLIVLVRFYALYRIKPHAPLLVRVPVNSFEFHSCERTTQAEYLPSYLATLKIKFPISSTHRLGRGLLGYLIRLATHAFVPQRQAPNS